MVFTDRFQWCNYEEHKTADMKPLMFIERFIPVKSTTIKRLRILGKKEDKLSFLF